MEGKPLIIFFLPPSTVRTELFPPQLPDFGTAPEKNYAGISGKNCSYYPHKHPPDILLVHDQAMDERAFPGLAALVKRYSQLYIALHHNSPCQEGQKYFFNQCLQDKKIVYQKFSRFDNDPLYGLLKELSKSITAGKNGADYPAALNGILKYVQIDWELENVLRKQHENLARSPAEWGELAEHHKMTILWNEDPFADRLRECFGKDNVITNPAGLDKKLKKAQNLLVLAELNWDDFSLAQCYGYQLAKEWIEKGCTWNMAFISFLDRPRLKKLPFPARLLAAIFPYHQLPLNSKEWSRLAIPAVSETKWQFIRRYVLEEGGILDQLEHKLKHLTGQASREQIEEVLQQLEMCRAVLTPEILALVETIKWEISANIKNFTWHKSALEALLKSCKEGMTSRDITPVEHTPYRIVIVEDYPQTLSALQEGFAPYFEVEGYPSAEKAREALRKNPCRYSALIVDLELLDEDGNWQPLQGYDLIEEASKISHLVIYMLSALSKQAISTIQSAMILNEVPYIPKDPQTGLPNFLSYNCFASELRIHIEKKRLHLKGPQNGVFAKGLLQYYYAVKESQNYNWKEIWQDIVERVDRFIEQGNNEGEIIPRQLFSQSPKQFNLRILTTVLMHRLIALYQQVIDGKVYFSDLQQSIGFNQQQGRRYFNQMLGFSIKDSENDEIYYLKTDSDLLFAEEEEWLKLKMDYRHLREMLHTIIGDKYLPEDIIKASQVPQHPVSLVDCLTLLEFFIDLSRISTSTETKKGLKLIAEDVDEYYRNYLEELEQLEKDSPIGCSIIAALKTIKNYFRFPKGN